MSTANSRPLVGIVMGSKSDWETMKACRDTLREFDIESDCRVLSAHRTPHQACEFATTAEERGLEVIVAAAGGAAHLAGVMAAHTVLPVLGVPMLLEHLVRDRVSLPAQGHADRARSSTAR